MPTRVVRKAAKKISRTKKASPGAAPEKPPRVSRPVVPADYGFPKTAKGLLAWKWARQRLTKSHNYVIVTVRPDGRPHAMGMHGLWLEDAFYFGTGIDTRKAKNLAVNTNCILINEHLHELIIVEGSATAVPAKDLPKNASAESKKKYGWPMGDVPGGIVFKVTPQVVFAFPEKQIATAVTRWIFD